MPKIVVDDIDFRRDPVASLNFKKHFKRLAAIPKPHEMTWDELHSYRSAITKEMESFLDRLESEKRDLNETEDVAYRTADDFLTWISEEFNRRNERGTKDPIKPDSTYHDMVRSNITVTPAEFGAMNIRTMMNPQKTDFRSLFNNAWPSYGWAADRPATWIRAALSGKFHPELEEAELRAGFNETSGVDGGYTIPSPLSNELLSQAIEDNPLLKSVRIVPMTSRTLSIAAWDMSSWSEANGVAGMTAQWIAEAQSVDPQKGKLRMITLQNNKLRLDSSLTREILQDSAMLESSVLNLLRTGLSNEIEKAIITGSGVARPQGLLNSPCLVKVTRAGAGAIAYADLVNMYSKMHKGYLKGAMWVMNHDAINDLLSMTINSNLVWSPAMFKGLADSPPLSLFGLPIYYSQYCSSVGSLGDCLLIAPQEYALGVRQEIRIERSESALWSTDEIAYRAIARIAGQHLWNSAVTIHSGEELSVAIALE